MNKINGILQKLKGGGRVKLIIIMGLAGMLLIMFSEIFSGSQKESRDKIQDIKSDSGTYENYAREMEAQLKKILERIDGVGNAEIMITVGATEEYVYAQEGKTQTGENSSSQESQYVIIGSGNEKEALLKKIVSPEISGVVIICEGGDSNIVKERVYNAVSAAFNISSQRIYVTKSNY